MLRRLILLAWLLGCARPPALSDAASAALPAAARPPAAPLAHAAPGAPAPSASTAAALPRPRWSTLPNSDTCVELATNPTSSFSRFPSKAECEAWVAGRHCRPGFRCFDGCNWRQCDDAGSGIDQTLAACSPRIVAFQFEAGDSRPAATTDWAKLVDTITTRLHRPERTLLVRGYAASGEAKNDAALARLAQARADAVARELVKHGILRKLLVVKVGSAADLPQHDGERSLVMVSVLPEQPLRTDFEPSSTEYRFFCGDSEPVSGRNQRGSQPHPRTDRASPCVTAGCAYTAA